MTKYVSNDGKVSLIADAVNINNKLPLGTYYISFKDHSGFFLQTTENIELQEKIYGKKITERTERIIHTFLSRTSNTGVLFSGIKGSGKSLQMKHVSETLREKFEIPSLIINTDLPIDKLTLFLNEINEPVAIIIDEFEKIFEEREEQEQFLSLLDGISFNKKLYLFTCNNPNTITEYMFARPSRIFYHYKYNAIDKDTVIGYCNDFLNNKQFIENIISIHDFMGSSFNFDILQSFVQESNRYNENPMDMLDILNIKNNNFYTEYKHFKYTIENNSITVEKSLEESDIIQLDMAEFYQGDTERIYGIIENLTENSYKKLTKKYEGCRNIKFRVDEYKDSINNEKIKRLNSEIIIHISANDIVKKSNNTIIFNIEDFIITLTELTNTDIWGLVK